ncbi:hypothetical protein [Streptacidiphilus cavernicola]|uniref:ADP-ribosylglycohydrolase n=1 Tax=Streptacidiphilus cavernicola TaxID=3342716 RepID=A0ABV6VZ44_9ACTN
MLTISGKKYDSAGFMAAVGAVVAAMGTTAPPEGSVQRGVLTSIVTLAASNAAAFDVVDVLDVYAGLVQQAVDAVPVTETARVWCRERIGGDVATRLAARVAKQPQTLAQLQALGSIVITRGMDPVQAQSVLTNGTFGGAVHDPLAVGAPQAADAVRQTGLGDKSTAAGRIEEWSLGMLTGFASNGFMLIAEAAVPVVTLPTSDHAVRAGEAGVCGFAAAALISVAILEEGRKLGDDPLQPELEKVKKAIGSKRIDVLALLKAAAHRLRGVNL